MELGLRLGDPPPLKDSAGLITTATVTAGVAASATTTTATVGVNTGFCMALGMNSVNGSGYEQDDHDDPGPYDHYDDEEEVDEEILREKGGIKDVSVSSQRRISSMNPPVQLDLLPSAPVPRHTSLPWSSDNGCSEGGSSGNVAAGRGLDAKLMTETEEATSSFRLSYDRRNGRENHKRGLEIGNDAVGVGSSRGANISDEDEHGRKKLRLSKEQSAYLEESFKEHNTLNPKQKHALAEQLNLRPRQVEVWFQNRRARTKLKQTEVDFGYLKRCCETLTDENRRLHKEVQELRALKTNSNPFYMQPPATTLTMCPSCERTVTVPTTTTPPPSTTTTLTKSPEQNPNKTTNTVSQRSSIFPSSN